MRVGLNPRSGTKKQNCCKEDCGAPILVSMTPAANSSPNNPATIVWVFNKNVRVMSLLVERVGGLSGAVCANRALIADWPGDVVVNGKTVTFTPTSIFGDGRTFRSTLVVARASNLKCTTELQACFTTQVT